MWVTLFNPLESQTSTRLVRLFCLSLYCFFVLCWSSIIYLFVFSKSVLRADIVVSFSYLQNHTTFCSTVKKYNTHFCCCESPFSDREVCSSEKSLFERTDVGVDSYCKDILPRGSAFFLSQKKSLLIWKNSCFREPTSVWTLLCIGKIP